MQVEKPFFFIVVILDCVSFIRSNENNNVTFSFFMLTQRRLAKSYS